MPQSRPPLSRLPFNKSSLLKAALLLSGLCASAATSVGAALPDLVRESPALNYCFTPPGGPRVCYASEQEALDKMRASTAVGADLVEKQKVIEGDWVHIYFSAEALKPPVSFAAPGFSVGGWSPNDLGCTPLAGSGPGASYCASEEQATSLWVARRAAFLAPYNCEYRKNAVVGTHQRPLDLGGPFLPGQSGSEVYGYGAEGNRRYIDEEWWCPGWGSPETAKHPTPITKVVPFTCPVGYYSSNIVADWPLVCRPADNFRAISILNTSSKSCPVGKNPCYASNGEKQRHEVDFEFAGDAFTRSYRSIGQFSQGQLGRSWNHSLGSKIVAQSGAQYYLVDDDGSHLRFEWLSQANGVTTYSVRGLSDRWARLVSGEFEMLDDSGHTRFYSAATGRLLRRRHASNPAQDLEYGYGSDGLLSQVVDGLGRKLSFHYDDLQVSLPTSGGGLAGTRQERLLTEVVLPDGTVFAYEYDPLGNLSQVRRPDQSYRSYHYNESAHVEAFLPRMMTGISDNGARYATFTYDVHGRVLSSTLAGGVERTSLDYVTRNVVDVTTPDGLVRRYVYAAGTQRRLMSVTDAFGTISNVYDGYSRRIESRDRAGQRTTFSYANGLVAQKTEAPGTSLERVTTFSRDTSGRVTATVVASKSTGTLVPVMKRLVTYAADGKLAASCMVDPNGPASQYVCGSAADAPNGVIQSTLTYCSDADAAVPGGTCPIAGLLRSVDGPLPGSGDSVIYDYRPESDLAGCASAGSGNCHRKGELWKVTDALGRVMEIQRSDLVGRATLARDPNGVITAFEYDTRGRIISQTLLGPEGGSSANDATTTFTYGMTGLVERMTPPDGAYVQFGYDAAHRLTSVQDGLGNVIEYALDGAGNRHTEETRDGNGALKRTLSRLFDELGRIETLVDASANATDVTYDAAGNIDTSTDALGRVTDHAHDALGRLRESIANVGGTGEQRAQTLFDYDALDRLTVVTDPKGLATQYEYDAFGRLVRLTSPDTGVASYRYDSAGNRIGQIDARGVETGYEYDVANRLSRMRSISSQPGGGNVLAEFTYDAAPTACQNGERFAVGRMSGFTDPSGSTDYCYDRSGNLVRKVQVASAGPTRTVRYQHNAAGRVMSVTYPSGLLLTYTRNAAGQITAVTAKNSANEAPVALVTGVDYLPFGPMTQLGFGNGRVLSKAYDLDYDIASVSDSAANGLAIGYSLDDVGRVVGLSERKNGGTTVARGLEYDGQDRLTALKNGATPVQAFTYDATGNRTSKRVGTGAASNYLYAPDSHRLTQVGSQTRAYDAMGNSVTIHARNYTYDDRGRMQQSRNGTTVLRDYRYNAVGQRVAKLHPTTATSSVFYVYDEAGRLLGEYKPNGALIKEYLWLDDTLVAVRGGYSGHKFQYVLTDHLNTPRAIVLPATDAIIWRWDLSQSAFGDHAAQNNPDGDTANYVFNLRYPGQYYDSETGLHYNYFRDYDPSTGRYVQSDPIGLAGGVSTFAYAGTSPLSYSDPFGLFFTSVDYACARDPMLCIDILGHYSEGQAALARNLCQPERAAYWDAAKELTEVVGETYEKVTAIQDGMTKLRNAQEMVEDVQEVVRRSGRRLNDSSRDAYRHHAGLASASPADDPYFSISTRSIAGKYAARAINEKIDQAKARAIDWLRGGD